MPTAPHSVALLEDSAQGRSCGLSGLTSELWPLMDSLAAVAAEVDEALDTLCGYSRDDMQELLGDAAIAEKLRKPVVVTRNKILREWEAAAAAAASRGATSLQPPAPSPLAAASAPLPSPASPPSTVAEPEPAHAKMQAAATEAGAMRAAKHDGIEPQPQTMAPVPQPQMMTTSPNALAADLQGNSQDQQPIQTSTATPTHQLGAIDQSVDVSSQVTSTAQQSGGADTAAQTPPPVAAVDQSVEVAGGAGPAPASSVEGTVTGGKAAAKPATGTHGSPNTRGRAEYDQRERAEYDQRERAEYDRIARALSCAQTPSAATATGDVAARLIKSSTSAYGYAGTLRREGYQVNEPQPQTAMAPAPVSQPPMRAPRPRKVGSATHLSLQQQFIAQDGSQSGNLNVNSAWRAGVAYSGTRTRVPASGILTTFKARAQMVHSASSRSAQVGVPGQLPLLPAQGGAPLPAAADHHGQEAGAAGSEPPEPSENATTVMFSLAAATLDGDATETPVVQHEGTTLPGTSCPSSLRLSDQLFQIGLLCARYTARCWKCCYSRSCCRCC
eukprot:COSAG01_NODE_4719_length_4794_cov_4.909478_4_plen_557_part_00